LPSLFTVGSYRIFFWSNEAGEPIHVHVCKGKPSPNTTKVWLTSSGGCILANNGSNIPAHDLHELMEIIAAQSFMIRDAWERFFADDEVRYYC
jgi:hypothetical protein